MAAQQTLGGGAPSSPKGIVIYVLQDRVLMFCAKALDFLLLYIIIVDSRI